MTMATANSDRGEPHERTHPSPEGRSTPPASSVAGPRAVADEPPLRDAVLDALDDAPIPIHSLDARGTIVWANRAELALLGYAPQEYVGRPLAMFHVDPSVAADVLARLARGDTVENYEVRLRTKDGGTRHALLSAHPIARDDARAGAPVARCFSRDITAHKRGEAERVQLARAEEATRLRDEFLALASHELRTPLTVLQLQLDALRTQLDASDRTTVAKLQRSSRACERLGELVEALLDVSRIATGRFALTLERSDAADIARAAADRLREAADAAGCAVTVVTQAAIGSWDRARIEQVIANLISNAVRYAAGTPIAIAVRSAGDAAVIEVRDHGPGLPEDQLGRLFERFERAASFRHYGGLGLGLYFVRQVIEAHGGQVTAHNAVDGGACVTLELPLDQDGDSARATGETAVPDVATP